MFKAVFWHVRNASKFSEIKRLSVKVCPGKSERGQYDDLGAAVMERSQGQLKATVTLFIPSMESFSLADLVRIHAPFPRAFFLRFSPIFV